MATYLRILLTVIVLLSVAVASGAADVARDQWIADKTKNLPALFCKEGLFYRDCFEVEQETCENAVMTAVQSCFDAKTEELPDIFTESLSQEWNGILEKCVNEEYDEMFINQKKDTPECSEK